MAVLEFLNVSTDGLKDFFWPCRMESFLIDDVTVVLDGCHNDHSVEQFMLGLRERYPDCHLQILFGAGMEKYLPDMLHHLFDHANSVLMVQSRHFKSLSELDLIGAVKENDRCLLQKSCTNISPKGGLSSDDTGNVDVVPNAKRASPPFDRREDGSVSERLLWSIEHAR